MTTKAAQSFWCGMKLYVRLARQRIRDVIYGFIYEENVELYNLFLD